MGTVIPQNMADLLSHQSLVLILGKDLIFWLAILFGAPNGLFLRNLLWHGFVLPMSILPQSYCQLVSHFLGLLERRFPLPIEHRRTFGNTTRFDLRQIEFWGPLPVLPSTEQFALLVSQPMSLRVCREGHASSSNVQDEHLNDSDDNDNRVSIAIELPVGLIEVFVGAYQRYHRDQDPRGGLTLVLPALETLLRILFVAAQSAGSNHPTADHDDTTESQLLASSDQHFLDFDHFLAAGPLVDALGHRTIAALCDFLTYPDGPRVKDKLGHGTCTADDVCPVVAHAFFEVVVHLLSSLSVVDDSNCQRLDFRCPSRFHPRTLVQQTIVDILELLRSLEHRVNQEWPLFADPVDPESFREFWRGFAVTACHHSTEEGDVRVETNDHRDSRTSGEDGKEVEWTPKQHLSALHLSRDHRSKLTWLRECSGVLVCVLTSVSETYTAMFELVALNTAVERQQRAFDRFVQKGAQPLLTLSRQYLRQIINSVENLDAQPLKSYRTLNTRVHKFRIAVSKNLWPEVEEMLKQNNQELTRS